MKRTNQRMNDGVRMSVFVGASFHSASCIACSIRSLSLGPSCPFLQQGLYESCTLAQSFHLDGPVSRPHPPISPSPTPYQLGNHSSGIVAPFPMEVPRPSSNPSKSTLAPHTVHLVSSAFANPPLIFTIPPSIQQILQRSMISRRARRSDGWRTTFN